MIISAPTGICARLTMGREGLFVVVRIIVVMVVVRIVMGGRGGRGGGGGDGGEDVEDEVDGVDEVQLDDGAPGGALAGPGGGSVGHLEICIGRR